MAFPAQIDRRLLILFLGLISGFLFTFIVGSLDAADYLMEQLSIGVIEVPFIILFAVLAPVYLTYFLLRQLPEIFLRLVLPVQFMEL